MDEKYRLVFRGEVLDGQHRAVVKRRLVESLKLDDTQAEKLFSGAAVVLKKAVDASIAARYQAIFKEAGGRLRVHVLAETGGGSPAQSDAARKDDSSGNDAPVERVGAQGSTQSAQASQSPPSPQSPPSTQSLAENQYGDAIEAPDFDLVSLEDLEKAVASIQAQAVEFSAPDYSLAELGVILGEATEIEVMELPDVDFELAEPGVDLLVERPVEAAVELGQLDFEVAEVGATIGDSSEKQVPPAPDTSHLKTTEDA
jgi:hypothetical protein